MPDSTGPPRLSSIIRPRPISDPDAEVWAEKGRRRSERPLQLAGPVANCAPVAVVTATDSDEWPYGNFMVGWLDRGPQGRWIRHVPDASFFLQLLSRAYEPVLTRRPDLAEVLTDQSRLEMSVTNDILQIQLDGLERDYSMIRHHALMLFFSALWLDEPRRSQWLDLYDELVSYADARPGGRPGLEELARIETDAFQDFVGLAPQTLDPQDARRLLESDTALDRILDYQVYAAVAIGLLWRDYRSLPGSERENWQREHLSSLYLRNDYLEQNWTDRR